MPSSRAASIGSESVRRGQPILSSRFCELRLVFTNSTATGGSAGSSASSAASATWTSPLSTTTFRSGRFAIRSRSSSALLRGSHPTGRSPGPVPSRSMSFTFMERRANRSGSESFQVRAMTDGLPSSAPARRRPDRAPPIQPRLLVGPQRRPPRPEHRRRRDRLVAHRPGVEEEQLGERADGDGAVDALRAGRIRATDRAAIPRGRGTPRPCRSAHGPSRSGLCSVAPSRHAPSANSWSSSVAMIGCAALAACTSGSRRYWRVAERGSPRGSGTRGAGRTAGRCPCSASGSPAASATPRRSSRRGGARTRCRRARRAARRR